MLTGSLGGVKIKRRQFIFFQECDWARTPNLRISSLERYHYATVNIPKSYFFMSFMQRVACLFILHLGNYFTSSIMQWDSSDDEATFAIFNDHHTLSVSPFATSTLGTTVTRQLTIREIYMSTNFSEYKKLH